MHFLATAVHRYLHEVLGISVPRYRSWTGQEKLPYFLLEAFDFWKLELLGCPILLVMDRGGGQARIGEIRSRLHKVQTMTNELAVYVTNSLMSFERKRLIEQKVPFIVPGNQLYLPDLGIDLREYFRQRPNTDQTSISPSAQALLITALLRPIWEVEWQPSEIIAMLGYTQMTRSRAVNELTAAGIIVTNKVGRAKVLRFVAPPSETWVRAKPILRSPIKRAFWALPTDALSKVPKRLAGLSALTRYSMLAEPELPVFAVSQIDLNNLRPQIEELPEPVAGACEWQVWNYSPALQPRGDTVDLCSLILSLKDNPDERVQIALDELKGQLPW